MTEETREKIGEIARFVRRFPINPQMKEVILARGLTVSEEIEPRGNPWSLYQDLAQHIEDLLGGEKIGN